MFERTKLKDALYGELLWEEWDGSEAYWFAPMNTDSGDDFSLLISADSPSDFMAVRMTHPTYKRIIKNVNSIRDEMIAEIMEYSRGLLKKKRQRDSFAELIRKKIEIFSIKINSNLSATVEFAEKVAENEEHTEVFYALLDPDGKLIEAGIEEL